MKAVPAPLPEAEIIDIQELGRLYQSGDIDLIVVLGPTASGKTKYAVNLASSLRPQTCVVGGNLVELNTPEIISADSRQVYRGMDIGTGKDLAEYGSVPYHLIDIAEAGNQYNVYEFQKDFIAAYADIRQRGCVPILCGGTGMYISAVTSGYDFRTRTSLSSAKSLVTRSDLPQKPYFIGTLVSREVRNQRIDTRLDARLKEGMVDEIRGLLNKGVSAETLISYGLEYKFVTLYILGDLTYEEMREKLSIAIHQFAKRQMTWFRGMERSGIHIHWTEGE